MNTQVHKIITGITARMAVCLFALLFFHSTALSQALPQGFVSCAKEGEQCDFRGTKEVWYGADVRWKVATVSNGIKCDYITFGGDPAYGTHKQCYISSASIPVGVAGTWKVITPNQSWTTMTITQTGATVTLAFSVKVGGQTFTYTMSGYVTDDRIFLPDFELTGTVFGGGTQIKWSALPDRLNNGARPAPPNATLARSEWELQAFVADTTNVRSKESDPPLSNEDMAKVMKWIATRVAAEQVPYCYKQTSYNKKIPEIGIDQCLSTQTGEVVPCYQPCPPGHPPDGKGECTGYVDEVNKWCTSPLVMVIGGNCRKPEAYGRGAGFTHFLGDPEGDCKKANPSTGCVYEGLAWYPKCKPGFHAVGLNICSPDCPAGFTDQGINCKADWEVVRAFEAKRVKQQRTPNSHRPNVACPPGTTQYLTKLAADIGLGGCYESCKNPRDTFAGPICWQACPSQLPTACAMGCAKDTAACVWDTADKVISPIMMAVNIATLGASSQATTGANAGTKGAKVAQQANKLTTYFKNIGNVVDTAKIAAAAKFGEQARQIDELIAIGSLTKTMLQTIKAETEAYQREVANNFATMTSDGANAEINSRFGPNGAEKIKLEWGRVHMQMREQKDSTAWMQTKIVLNVISLEPTGIVGVINAYAHPICGDDTPFPRVTKLYID